MNGNWDRFHTVAGSTLRRIYVHGSPGIGKSHISYEIAATGSEQMPFQATLNDDTVVQELQGHYVPEGNKFVWHDGPFIAAWRQGIPLVINEVARASGAVQDFLLGVLDDPAIASITLPTGERLRPAPGFRVFATANSSPDELDEALRDRFDAVIHVTAPHPNLVKKLNQMMQGLGDMIADSYKDPKRAISPRKAIAFVELRNSISKQEGSIPQASWKAAAIVFNERAADFLMVLKTRGGAV